ncbi:nucleotidyltransferase [Paenibacillus sp. SC116]|uniref:nucleotidyltransferase n=1 Tax=Paenibacillus sp. SC116 TaxID=2968986 RepID=UPI00215AAC38|nr:nucleotidyltransferase [Paenibacillus sp. SC116]MCR8843948.1 nucleotidyltransferase [Paenibacillus sp. SC116]
MLLQEKLIEKVSEKCRTTASISSCMMYGSFTKGEGDQYSDVEFYIFIKDEDFQSFSSSRWIGDIEPYDLLFLNEYGTEVVVFSSLIRGEFHFLPESDIGIITSFKDTGYFPDTTSMFVYDTTGQLQRCLDHLRGDGPERMTNDNVNNSFHNFVNAWLMGVNVLKRGELARSLECLSHVQRFILRLIRIREKSADLWLNAAKNVEKDISAKSYQAYVSITSKLDRQKLYEAYRNALHVVEDLIHDLSGEYQFEVDKGILRKLNDHLHLES